MNDRYYDDLDEFLSHWSNLVVFDHDAAPSYVRRVSRWYGGDAEIETQRMEDLLIDDTNDIAVIVGRGGIDTYWGGTDRLQILAIPKAAVRQYLHLRAELDNNEAEIYDSGDDSLYVPF